MWESCFVQAIRLGFACVFTIKLAHLELYRSTDIRLHLIFQNILAYGVVFVLVSWGEGTHGSFLSPQTDLGLYPPSTW